MIKVRFELFADEDPLGIYSFFLDKARDIQNGGEEFCYSKDWLGIWWPADEYMFIKLTVENKIDDFYTEAETILYHPYDFSILNAIRINKELLKQPDGDLDKWLKEVVWWGNKKGAYLNAAG